MELKLNNSIEDVVPHLHEVGQCLVLAAGEVVLLKNALESAQRKLDEDADALCDARADLLQEVLRNYVESEIEAADVLCNRCAFSVSSPSDAAITAPAAKLYQVAVAYPAGGSLDFLKVPALDKFAIDATLAARIIQFRDLVVDHGLFSLETQAGFSDVASWMTGHGDDAEEGDEPPSAVPGSDQALIVSADSFWFVAWVKLDENLVRIESEPQLIAGVLEHFELPETKDMSEEELVIFEILTRPSPALTTEERAEVKKVARNLLSKLKSLLVLDWRQKSAARSQVKLAIEDALDLGLPRAYTPELYQQKCSAVFEHVYESYQETNRGVYAAKRSESHLLHAPSHGLSGSPTGLQGKAGQSGRWSVCQYQAVIDRSSTFRHFMPSPAAYP